MLIERKYRLFKKRKQNLFTKQTKPSLRREQNLSKVKTQYYKQEKNLSYRCIDKNERLCEGYL